MTGARSYPSPELVADIKEILIPAEVLHQRVAEMGHAISQDYAGRNPLLVGVLKGVLFFMADLLRAITIPVEMDFIAVSSYSPESRAQGVVRLVKDLEAPLAGRHVLFVEDVIDTGLTLNYILKNLRSRQPPAWKFASCLTGRSTRLIDIPVRYKVLTCQTASWWATGWITGRNTAISICGSVKANAIQGGGKHGP
jgi:hypoxanthine phosphoribosyltransferase